MDILLNSILKRFLVSNINILKTKTLFIFIFVHVQIRLNTASKLIIQPPLNPFSCNLLFSLCWRLVMHVCRMNSDYNEFIQVLCKQLTFYFSLNQAETNFALTCRPSHYLIFFYTKQLQKKIITFRHKYMQYLLTTNI